MSDNVLSQTANAVRKREARTRRTADVMTLAVEPVNAVQVPEPVIDAVIKEVARGETFTFVGYAVDPKGRGAVRYTNDWRRGKTLIRLGCTNVVFVELPQPMTKAEIDASEFVAQVVPEAVLHKSA